MKGEVTSFHVLVWLLALIGLGIVGYFVPLIIYNLSTIKC